jgi:hypothetical protein
MQENILKEILWKLLTDDAFRDRFYNDTDALLAEHTNLNEQDIAFLQKLVDNKDSVSNIADAFASLLPEREEKGFVNIGV